MEVKKSPRADLESKKILFLAIGLIVALALTLVAFTYGVKPEQEPYEPSVKELPQTELDMIERTDQEEKQEEKQEEQKKVETKVIMDVLDIVSDDADIKVTELVFADDASAFDDIDFSFDVDEVEEEIDEDDEIFTILEDPATFRGGGLPEFRNWVMERLRYPQIAQENGIQGNVIIEFVVDTNGEIANIKVLQSPDPVLSDAAIAVLKKSPKWKPGKQRGKAVKQKFVLPVSFKLQN
jgi:protein TonB